ncbi:hypothetical protein [Aerosakkonema funiforme]|uniref:hypothetical protein n=1 Tax=Aerosakkonema funiforme TaxID=1246630 RepID=UPI0035B75522
MNKRQTIIEKFSTFGMVEEFTNYLSIRWMTEPRLKRNMEELIKIEPEGSEQFWALYWLKATLNSPTNSLSKWHLSAYLEETCHIITIKICQQFPAYSSNLVDCFLIARDFASNPNKLFANYDTQLSSVNTYAQLKIKTFVLEELRRGKETEKYSDWALLRSLNPTSLQQALQKYGFKESQLAPYNLAWRCFKEIYTPSTTENSKQLSSPNEVQWNAIANRYNQLRSGFKLESTIKVQELQRLLKTILQAVRQQSHNSPASARSLDDLDPSSPVPQTLISQENSDFETLELQWERVNSILSKAFADLPDENRKMLFLWHGLGFRQTEIAQLFGLQQFQFSRKMAKSGKLLIDKLLEEFVSNNSNNLEGRLDSTMLNKNTNQIYIWIEPYCKNSYWDILKSSLINENKDDLKLLQLYYGQSLPLSEASKHLKVSENEISARLKKIKEDLREKLKHQVENNLLISLSRFPNADERLSAFVNDYLVNAPYASF